MTRGQMWSLDFTIGFTLFLVTFFLVATTLARTALLDDGFKDVAQSAEGLSNLLLTDGYPSDWRPGDDDLVTYGLLTEERLSRRKIERLAGETNASVTRYEATKNALNLRYDYAFFVTDANGTILDFGQYCHVGSPAVAVNRTLRNATKRIAYYAPGEQQLLAMMEALNATIYGAAELGPLLGNLSDYDLVVLEQPRLSSSREPSDATKGNLLEEYLLEGGELLVVGDLALPDLFSSNITVLEDAENVTVAENDMLLNLSASTPARTLIVPGGFALTPLNDDRYVSVAQLDDGRDLAATLRYGDGDFHYLGTLDGSIDGRSLLTHVETALADDALFVEASCAAVTFPSRDARNLVAVRRLAAYDGRIVILKLAVWEAR